MSAHMLVCGRARALARLRFRGHTYHTTQECATWVRQAPYNTTFCNGPSNLRSPRVGIRVLVRGYVDACVHARALGYVSRCCFMYRHPVHALTPLRKEAGARTNAVHIKSHPNEAPHCLY